MLKVAPCTVVRSYNQIFSAWWVTTILYSYGATLCELRYQWCNVFGGFPPFRIHWVWNEHVTLSLDWFWPFFWEMLRKRYYQNWFGNSFLSLSLISMLTEQLKFVQIFPITNVFDLSFSDWEYQLTKDPRVPHMYAVHHYDRVATEWKQRKYTPQDVYL